MAHLARGDHWVARLELLVEAAWWWNPLFWLARRRIHEQAEIACDARVVRSWPDRRYAYAEALVDVCEHIARARSTSTPSPALGVGGGGAGAAHSLEGRLNMILQDSIPRRPTRRAALLSLLLLALALPAWTLGQQPEPPTPRPPDAASSPSPSHSPKPASIPGPLPEPSAAPTPAPASTIPTVTIAEIVAARASAAKDLAVLSFRYVVTSRDQSRPNPRSNVMVGGGMGGGGMGGGGMGGGMGGGGMGGMMGGGRGGNPAMNPRARAEANQRVKTVRIQVADVTVGSAVESRLDVIEAQPRPEASTKANPHEPPPPLTWDRRFVARDGSGLMILETDIDQAGPVPLRKLEAADRVKNSGDSLASMLANNSNTIDPDRGIDPFDPRPANLLDWSGASTLILDGQTVAAEVAGVDVIAGREAIRVAWYANMIRGLCWVAPSLGYAVVRSDATMDPTLPGQGRRAWRKRSSDFVQVSGLWLPRQVTYEESEADPAGGEPFRRRERRATFEEFRAVPTPSPETFHPRLAIQALDDLSGQFTARPPEIAPGLVDRLRRAVADSEFGPPLVEKTTEALNAEATPPTASTQPPTAVKPRGREYADIVTNVDEVPTGRLMFQDAAKPPLRVADAFEPKPIPAAKPSGLENPAPVEKAAIDPRVEGLLKIDPEIAALTEKIKKGKVKLESIKRTVRSDKDPALIIR